MGFTRQQIIDLYADIFERFGFDKREPILSKAKQKAAMENTAD
jgi:hypothetical protein